MARNAACSASLSTLKVSFSGIDAQRVRLPPNRLALRRGAKTEVARVGFVNLAVHETGFDQLGQNARGRRAIERGCRGEAGECDARLVVDQPQHVQFMDVQTDAALEQQLRGPDRILGQGCYGLVEFCRKAGRVPEALRWAEEGLRTFADERPDARLVDAAIALMTEAGRKAEAITLARSTFERQPDLSAYRRWRKLAGEAACEQALAVLETRARETPPSKWSHPADPFIDILMEEENWTAAWVAVAGGGASPDAQLRLARASDRAHPQEAAEVFRRAVDQLVEGGAAQGYEEAAKLVKRMAALQSPATQAAWVVQLKTRFARRRNFMKLLG